jgi:hypothetical protein
MASWPPEYPPLEHWPQRLRFCPCGLAMFVVAPADGGPDEWIYACDDCDPHLFPPRPEETP